MKTQQATWSSSNGWDRPFGRDPADLVLLFGGGNALADASLVKETLRAFPGAAAIGCTTAGEIAGIRVTDDGLVATAVRLAGSKVRAAHVEADEHDGRDAGARLARLLPTAGLRHVLVLSDGTHVNGSSLVEGMQGALPPGVQVTGGLAGDGARFQRTLVLAGGEARERRIAAVGFYGDGLRVGYGSLGGWDPFGPPRRVTRSKDNVLYELDGRPALQLYKEYLGPHASGLPATGLLFPLSVQRAAGAGEVVRTILGVSEEDQSLTFAGDVPEGAYGRLMKANFDRLVDGAQGAARTSHDALGGANAQLAVLISCVGRKLVLKQRVEDELEAVREVVGPEAAMAGFYSYGEICPAAPNAACELHNQTMTITTFRET